MTLEVPNLCGVATGPALRDIEDPAPVEMEGPAAENLADFCRRMHPRLVGALGLHCGDRGLAEELAQEALARACRDWAKVSRADSPDAWLFRTALNLTTSWFRRRRVATRPMPAAPPATEVDGAAAIVVRAAVRALPQRQRTAIVLRYYLDLPVAQAADVMGCADGTVRALTSQGRESLRRALGPEFSEEDDA